MINKPPSLRREAQRRKISKSCRPKMLPFRTGNLSRRLVALIAASVTAAACMTAAPEPTPASAATASASAAVLKLRSTSGSGAMQDFQDSSGSEICLTNKDAYCTSIDPGTVKTVIDAILHAVDVIIIYRDIYQGRDDQGDDEEEEQVEGEEGGGTDDEGLCLADTGGYAYLASCGADGTVWIVVPHTDGDYLYSRYTVDEGNSMVLTADPVTNGARLFVAIAAQPGSADWQTWSGALG